MKILLVTNASLNSEKMKIQNEFLSKSAGELGIEIEVKKNNEIFYAISDKNNSELEKFDAVLFYDKDIFLCRKLEELGLKVFNSSECIKNCDNKALTYEILAKNNIKIPKTYLIPMIFFYKMEYYTEFIEKLEQNLSYPMIAKKWFGSEGKQVYLIQNHDELLELIDKEQGKELLFQEYFKECHGTDIRIVVIDNKVVTSTKLTSANGDFRSNVANGGIAKIYSPTDEEKQLAIEASKALECNFCGVDILQTNRGPVICEVNSNAHLKEISEMTNVNVAKDMLKYIISQI